MNQSRKSNRKKNKRQTPSLIKPQDIDNSEHNNEVWLLYALEGKLGYGKTPSQDACDRTEGEEKAV